MRASRDPATAMLKLDDFLNRLDREIADAYELHRPLSLILFEMEEFENLADRQAQVLLRLLSSRLWETAQMEDTLGRPTPERLSLILPGSGHFHALALTESVISDVWNSYAELGPAPFNLKGAVTMPDLSLPGAMAGDDLLSDAIAALKLASGRPDASVRERVKLYRRSDCLPERETLVLANEKHFLFFGGA